MDEMSGDELLLKVDIFNAYNSICRNACLRGKTLLHLHPALGPLVPERPQPRLLQHTCGSYFFFTFDGLAGDKALVIAGGKFSSLV